MAQQPYSLLRAASDPPRTGFVRPRSRKKILEQKRALLEELASPTGSLPNLVRLVGQQVTLEMKVDPAIIGGMVALVGDTMIDGSVRTRLQNLRKQLT